MLPGIFEPLFTVEIEYICFRGKNYVPFFYARKRCDRPVFAGENCLVLT